jgi:uncharacterized protein
MAVISTGARHALPDSAFAYIEPGHDSEKLGSRTPDKYRHFPVHDANHVRNALARIAQGARFGSEAKAKVMAAAKRLGIEHDESASTGRAFESLYPEVRFLSDVPEIRSIGEGQPVHITGYAAAFNKLSRRLGGFVERVMPGAFDGTLSAIAAGDQNVNMVCRFNHKDDMLLGTTQAGTLQLTADERGLYYDVIPPKHRGDVVELVQRGDVRYSSFAFRCVNPGEDDSWGVTDYGFPMRSLHKVEGLDVAPVTDPAYRDTTAMARNMTGAVESLAMWVDAEPAEVRSMLEAGQASRFFKRTDRPSAPRPAPVAAPEEHVMLDDPAVALRRWSYAPEPDGESRDGARACSCGEDCACMQEAAPEGERAMHTHEQMCKQYTHGEPCVLAAGHDGDHAQRCHTGQYGEHGLPCAKPQGHAGEHAPMSVDDDEPQRGPGRPRKRDGEDTEAAHGEETRQKDEPQPGKRTLSGPEALLALEDMRRSLARID